MQALADKVKLALADLARQNRLRTLNPCAFGPYASSALLDLSSNDYLGLRQDKKLHARILEKIQELPQGAGASRLLGGEHPVFSALENDFSAFQQAPASLFFSSGYAANEAVASSLARLPGVAFFSDALNHASIIDGIRLAGLDKQSRSIFAHNDMSSLQQALKVSTADINVIFSETVFSMDGDRAPLADLAELAQRYRGLLVLDEAHAILCMGPDGRGLTAEAGLAVESTIRINTCGKAMAAQGALVSGPEWWREFLINTARPFIYSTGPSPWMAAAVREAVQLSPQLHSARQHLADSAAYLRQELQNMGFDTLTSSTHIIPILCGSDQHALGFAAALAERGIACKAVRPPTVPEGYARLRLSLSASISADELSRLVDTFKQLRSWRTPI